MPPRLILPCSWLCTLLIAVGCARLSAVEPTEILLWPYGAPGSEGKTSREVVDVATNGERRVSNVHFPSITSYVPAREKNRGFAVLVIPGGGHRILAIDHEGHAVGQWLSDHGIAAFVLKYRLARETNSTYKVDVHALSDVQRALQLIRSRAHEWYLDPARLGVMGFSAGGELASLASTRFEKAGTNLTDQIERQSTKPDFQALIYPGNTSSIVPTKESPPAFLACAYNDRPDISEGLANIYLKFKQAGVPAELHIYSTGGHGFGVRANNPKPGGDWIVVFDQWLSNAAFPKKR
jgi:acetyl esterase/lipase